jgi:hypothetical protein
MTGSLGEGTALAAVCWDDAGKHLIGLIVVRRSDGHACLIDLPEEMQQQLATVDPVFVTEHAAQLLALVYRELPRCVFEVEEALPPDFLSQGQNPAEAGAMRYVSADNLIGNVRGMPNWNAAGFVVDIGEIDLSQTPDHEVIH